MQQIMVINWIMFSIILETRYICSAYIYKKLNKIEITKTRLLYVIISSITISCLCSFLKLQSFLYYGFLFLILSFITLVFLYKDKYYTSIPNIIISFGIEFCIESISVLLVGTFFYLLGFSEVNLFNESISCVVQFIITFLVVRIKRLRNGLTFFRDKNNFALGLTITGPILFLISLNKDYLPRTTMIIIITSIIISIIGILLWIRSAFKRYYRKRLKLRAEEYSKIELAEKEKEIEKLSDENTSLSSIIHLDNHIIQSIESELKALNNSELADKLLTSINQRNEYVNDLLIKSKNLASTGNAEIDAVLLDLYIKSASRGIDYNLSADCDINYLLNNIISLSGFETLLRKLITNSIVDIENNPDIPGRISIKISQPNDIYELTVMDNGISKENNNSIPDIVEKSKASILINKFNNNDSFTKSVTIRFDGLKIHC